MKAALVAILVASAAWAVVWTEVSDSALTRVLRLDEAFYMQRALEIADGQLLPDHGFYRSPLYPYFVAALGGARPIDANGVLVEGPPWPVRVAQAALWTGVALLIWRMARRRLSSPFALLAVGLFVLYRPGAIFVSTILVEVPLLFCIALLLDLLDREPAGRPAGWLAAGLLIGAGALLRGHVLVLLVPATFVVFTTRISMRARLVRLGAAGLGAALLLLPAALHNSMLTGSPSGPVLNGGINLLIGNRPGATGFFDTLEGHDFFNDVSGELLLATELGRPVAGAGEADRIWRRRAFDAIADDPGHAAALWLKKVWLHLVSPEISSITPLGLWAEQSRVLSLMVVPWGLIAALGIAGALSTGFRQARWRLYSVTLIVLVAVQSLFFVTTRYRLALLVPLVLLGAGFAREVTLARGRGLATRLGLLVVCAVATIPFGLERPLGNLRTAGIAHAGVNALYLGQHLDGRDAEAQFRVAADLLERRLAASPGDLESWQHLARAHFLLDDPREAERTLERGIASVADPVRLESDRIRLLHETGRDAEAVAALRQYLGHNRADANMWHLLVYLLESGQPTPDGLEAAEAMLAAVPGDPRAWTDLGVALARRGRLAEAERILTEGASRFPGAPALRANLERVRAERH